MVIEVVKVQQSHHCGIETRVYRHDAHLRSWQQSHHCGIETYERQFTWLMRVLQQSHHCGIETVTTATGDWRIATEAIATLLG